ncbi:hypothetical protein [Nonomuraea glycinis]|uniref:hypothetical protein n=1 Tax=Nonomuraea glycinis TaxID=2047744 RepID=UPI0033B3EB85
MEKRMAGAMGQLVLAAMVAAVTGCAGNGDGTQSDRVTIEGSDPRILVHQHTDFGMQALLTGQLTFNLESKCLVVRNTGESPPRKEVIPVWPQDAHPVIKDGKRGVQLGDGPILLEGAEVKLSGGYVDWSKSMPLGLEVSDSCIADLADSATFEVSPFTSEG